MEDKELEQTIERIVTLRNEADDAQDRGDMGASSMRHDEASQLEEELRKSGHAFVEIDEEIHIDNYLRVFSIAEWQWRKQDVSRSLAGVALLESIRQGKTIEIPSLGIVLTQGNNQ